MRTDYGFILRVSELTVILFSSAFMKIYLKIETLVVHVAMHAASDLDLDSIFSI